MPLQILLPLSHPPPSSSSSSSLLSQSLSLALSLLPLLPIGSLPFPWLKGNKSAGSCITLHRLHLHLRIFFFFFKSPSPFLFFSSSLLDEMIRFPTEACCVFCCGGGALFSVGRLSCPQALPVGDGDSPQNSCHMKLCPATSHA